MTSATRYYCKEAWRLYDLWILLYDDPDRQDECAARFDALQKHCADCEECE